MNSKAPAPERLERVTDISQGWMQKVLTHAGVEARVSGIELNPFGEGKVSDTAQVRISYTEQVEGAPSSVICKFHSAQAGAHQFAISANLYRGELHSYQVIGAQGACRMPHAYLAEGDDQWINLVLADLSETTEPGDQLRACSLEQARAVMHEVADLHSHFAEVDPEDAPAWMTRLPEQAQIWREPSALGARLAAEWFADRLPADYIRLLERLPDATERFFVYPLNRMLLTHGDVRADNIMFAQEDGQTRALLIDWQNVGLRSPAFDFAYFLSGSVLTEDRRKHEQDLLTCYADRLAEKSEGYDFDLLLEDYRTQLLSGAIQTAGAAMFMSAGGAQELSPDAQHFLVVLLERNLAAIDDWDSIGALKA
jgi:thiamine kinase-like enzyme